MKLFNYYLIILGFVNYLGAQDLLTVNDAIKIGLEKNYDVLIVKNNQEIAKAQNNFGNAGMSPTVSLNANLNLANVNSYQEFSSGATQDRNGAQSFGTGASINANWTIFDGLRMFAVKKRLNLNEELYAIELQQQMETTVYNIIINYYEIVRINELIKASKQNLKIYEERKKIAKLKMEIGSDSKVDFLLTQSEENKAKSSIIQLDIQLLSAKTKLNLLLNKPANFDFNASDSIVINYDPNIDEIKKNYLKTNSNLLLSKKNELIFSQTVKEARALNLPYIQVFSAYNFTQSQNQAGFVFLNKQAGINAGLTASWLIFNGNKNKKLIQERNLLGLNQKYISDQILLQVDGIIYVNYKTFLLNKQIVHLELQNLKDAKEVLSVSLERYKIGKANLLETIEIQKNLEDAQVRYINALYAIKVSETELLRATGTLVK